MALEHGIRLSAPQSAARRQALAPRVGHTGRPEAEGATFSPGIVTPVASLVDLPYLAAIVTRGDGLAACALGGGLVWRRPEPETRDWPDGMMLLRIDRYAVDAAVRGMRRTRNAAGARDAVAAGAMWLARLVLAGRCAAQLRLMPRLGARGVSCSFIKSSPRVSTRN